MYKKIVFAGALLAGMSAVAMELTVTPEVDDQVVIYLGEEENEITLPKKYAELMGILEMVDDPAFVAKFRFQEVTLQGWKFIAEHLERLYKITQKDDNADRFRLEIFSVLKELEDKNLIEVLHAADYLQISLLLNIAFNGPECTLLHVAANRGLIEVVELLVGRPEVEVNAVVAINGHTPLHWAAHGGHVEVVKLLLGRDDIKVNIARRDGSTPLHLAAQNGHKEIVKLLLRRDDIEVNAVVGINGHTPLHWAAQEGHVEVVKLLLDRADIKVNATTSNGFTPLQWAAGMGRVEVVKLLLLRDDIEVNAAGLSGSTPLYWAARGGHAEVVRLLLGRDDILVNTLDNSGFTPLHCAASKGHVEVVKLLFGRDDIKINVAGRDGYTPLHWAALSDHREMCLCLLTYGLITKENRARGAQAILNEYTPLLNAIYSRLSEENPSRALFSEINRGEILEMLKQGLADSDSHKHNINNNNNK